MAATPRPSSRGQSATTYQRSHSAQSRASSRGSRAPSATGSAFGRHATGSKMGWDATSYVGGSEAAARTPNMHVFTPEEIGVLDSITIGGPSGSVRLSRYVAATGLSSVARSRTPFQVPFTLQDPVVLTVCNGMVQVSKAVPRSSHNGASHGLSDADIVDAFAAKGDEIALIPIDNISKVELTTTGLVCVGRGGLDLALTIHSVNKKNVLYKLLSVKTKGVVPATWEEEREAKEQEEASGEAKVSSVAVPLVRDATAKARMVKTIDDNIKSQKENNSRNEHNQVRSSSGADHNGSGLSPGGDRSGRSTATTLISSLRKSSASASRPAPAGTAPPAVKGAESDRQARREVLYAQLKEIRQREATRSK